MESNHILSPTHSESNSIEELLGIQHMGIYTPPDGSTFDLSELDQIMESTTPQMNSETCFLCNNSNLLYKPDGTLPEPVADLRCRHIFHLKCIIDSLKKDHHCPRCQQAIYFNDDESTDEVEIEKNWKIERFLGEFALKPVVFEQSPNLQNDVTETSLNSQMEIHRLYHKILRAEANLENQERAVARTKYEILDSYYLLGKAIEDKSAELKSKHPVRSAQTMLNREIRRQFPSNITRNRFNKRKRSALNIYRIFSTEGIGRDKIQRIRSFTPLVIGKFTDIEIKIIKEKGRLFFVPQSENTPEGTSQTNENEIWSNHDSMEIC